MDRARPVHPAWAAAPRWVRVMVSAASAAAVALPLVLAAGRAQPFRDELATAQVARLSLGDLWRATENVDRVLLPHLLLMKGWVGLAGDSTLALRAPSVLAGVCLVAVVAVLGGRLAGPVGGAVAGLVLALAPLTATLAVLARPYAAVSLVAVLALLVLHLALESGRRGWWVAHAALVTASLLLQPFAVLALPAHVALAATTPARHRWRRVVGVWAAAGGIALLLAASARGQQGQVGWIAEVGPRAATSMVRGLVSESVFRLGVFGCLAGLVLVATRRRAPWWWVGTALVLGPPLLLAVVSALLQPAFVARYLFLVPAGAALLVGGLAGAVADAVAGGVGARDPAPGGAWRRPLSAVLLAAAVVAAVVVPLRIEVRPIGGSDTTAQWSADPPSDLAEAVGEVLKTGDLLVVEQRVGWGGYAGALARSWGDDDLTSALDRRAVSGDLTDVTRIVTETGPPRTLDPTVEPLADGPVRVVLLSLRSTADERYVEAARAGCSAGARSPDRRLGDTRLWVVSCETVPGLTGLSAVADDPIR